MDRRRTEEPVGVKINIFSAVTDTHESSSPIHRCRLYNLAGPILDGVCVNAKVNNNNNISERTRRKPYALDVDNNNKRSIKDQSKPHASIRYRSNNGEIPQRNRRRMCALLNYNNTGCTRRTSNIRRQETTMETLWPTHEKQALNIILNTVRKTDRTIRPGL